MLNHLLRRNALLVIISVLAINSCERKEAQDNIKNEKRKIALQLPEKTEPQVKPVSSLSVKIGLQEWMTTNLNVAKFRNGDLIPEAKSDKEWDDAGTEGKPAWCYYLNNECIGGQYGRLYNFFAVEDPRGIAPEGWHVATDEEWLRLTRFLKENQGDKLKSESGWYNGGNGTNETGFSALPGGMRYYSGEFMNLGNYGFWWTSSSVVITHAHLRYMVDDYGDRIFSVNARRAAGMSVRCIKDYETK